MSKSTKNLSRYMVVCTIFFLIVICIFLVIRYRFDINRENTVERKKEVVEVVALPSSLAVSDLETPERNDDLNAIELKAEADSDAAYENILDTVMATNEQAAQLYEAEEVLVKQCMNERGFQYIPNKADNDLEFPERVKQGDIEMAQTRGYGITENIAFEKKIGSDTIESVNSDSSSDSLSSQKPNSNDTYLRNLSEEEQQKWHEALMGKIDIDNLSKSGTVVSVEDVSTGSTMYWDTDACLTNARRELFGSDVKHMEDTVALHSLQKRMIDYVDENKDFKNSFSKWKSCMAENDLPNEYFGQAADVLSDQYYKGELTEEELKNKEIKAAYIDASCYQQHGLDDALVKAEGLAEKRLWEESSDIIIGLQTSLSSSLENSKKYSEILF